MNPPYALFVIDNNNFSAGGWEDFAGFFPDMESACQAGRDWIENHPDDFNDITNIDISWQVVDLQAGKIVRAGGVSA